MQRSRRIAHPTGIETYVDDHVLDFRQAPSVAIVEKKTAPFKFQLTLSAQPLAGLGWRLQAES